MDKKLRTFLKELETFDYDLSCLDHFWTVLFPDNAGKWHKLDVNKYRETYYIAHHDRHYGVIEVPPRKPAGMANMDDRGTLSELTDEVWPSLIADAHTWLKVVGRDWVKAAKRVLSEYPLSYRKGIVSHAVVRDALPDLYRLDRELGIRKCRQIVKLVDDGYFLRQDNYTVSAMTANRYFEYCRIAYLAAAEKNDPVDSSLSGREMYRKYADGRDGGLQDIDPDSETAFADWLDGKDPANSSIGCHPWEIKRGGNTTHIDLYVYRPKYKTHDGFILELCGESFTRMAETIRMFLAIHKAGLPIVIANPEAVRKRILGQDNLGIIPEYDSPHRANQSFTKEQCVYDVIYFKMFGRFKRRIVPFVTWEPLPLLRPRD